MILGSQGYKVPTFTDDLSLGKKNLVMVEFSLHWGPTWGTIRYHQKSK